MKKLLLLSFILGCFTSHSQFNLDSLSHLDLNTIHNCDLNDIWGYVDETGNEYAIVGATNGTSIVDVTDPANPVELFWEIGNTSVWRDIKTFGDYAFVTTEAVNGLLIIDMSPLPGSTLLTTSYYLGGAGPWQSAHNLYVDENGYAYIFGANRDNGGVIILDCFTDPMNPVEVGTFDNWYVHDGFVRNDTMYLAHIGEGFFSVVDVTDKANPVLLGVHDTPSTFSHNIWPSDDGDYVYTTDEVSSGFIGAYDISDLGNIVEVDRVQSSPGSGVIPHNVHVANDYLVTSYYSDGVVVHDAQYPYNLVEVGSYDTYPGQTMSYDGCWGVYPFLPSGTIIASDQDEGLFILGSSYTRAAYLEGIVTNSVTLAPLDQVEVSIVGSPQTELTDGIGFYATGMADAGSYSVNFSKVGYFPQTIDTVLVNDVITQLDVALVPIPPFNLTVNVLDAVTLNPIDGANIRLKASLINHEGVTNALGEEQFSLFYEESYDVIVGKWGYKTTCSTESIDASTGTLTVYLNTGVYDDFSFDYGWTASGTAVTGMWERGIPYGNLSATAPLVDVDNDCGEYCLVTGNDTNLDPDAGDVDGGITTITSPVIDLSGYSEPYVLYKRWFYNYWGPGLVDDTLRVRVSDGTNTVEIDKIGSDPSQFGEWVAISLKLSDFVSITSNMQFFFETSDIDPEVNITEAAIDIFEIVEETDLSVESLENGIGLYPNPANNEIILVGIDKPIPYSIISLDGINVKSGVLDSSRVRLDDLGNGVYFIRVAGSVVKFIVSK